ncbi:MAG: hypothetical protein GY750_09580 [Lentisphaerae bacterium]|nr:hypothetical protein [Lentisphaerota bacterium]MCP4101663.1 hypothetical protein [Lentisphaerota bacterium]
MARLIAALALIIASFAILIAYSIEEAVSKKKLRAYVKIIKTADSVEAKDFKKAIKSLEHVIVHSPPVYAKAARLRLERIHKRITAQKQQERANDAENELKKLRTSSYKLELAGEYSKAIAMWKFYIKNSPMRFNDAFKLEVQRTIQYLESRSKDASEF